MLFCKKKEEGAACNPWIIITIILAIALIGVLVAIMIQSKKGDKIIIVPGDVAAKNTLNFINEVYVDQIGKSTLKTVGEENCLYKLTILSEKVTDKTTGQPTDQFVFVTKDGKIFIPMAFTMDEMLAKYRDMKAAAAQQPPADINAPADAPAGN